MCQSSSGNTLGRVISLVSRGMLFVYFFWTSNLIFSNILFYSHGYWCSCFTCLYCMCLHIYCMCLQLYTLCLNLCSMCLQLTVCAYTSALCVYTTTVCAYTSTVCAYTSTVCAYIFPVCKYLIICFMDLSCDILI